MRTFLTMFALVSAATAQGVLPLSQTMRFGSLGADFAGPCGVSPTPTVFADEGTIMFRPDGRISLQVTTCSVCPGGTTNTSPVQTGTGTYDVHSDGVLALEWSPATPGADPDALYLRADGAVFTRSRKSEHSDESILMIGIALSSGHSAGSLRGAYHEVRVLQRNAASGLSMIADRGVVTFDGQGGWVDQGTRHTLPWGGTGSTSGYGPIQGSYAVAADGTVTTGIGATGAVSADGEVFFWLRHTGTDLWLTIGVRQGTNYDTAMVGGDWRIAALENAIEATAMPGELRTDWGTMTLQPSGPGGGNLSVEGVHVVTSPSQTVATNTTNPGAFTLSPQGDLTLFSGSVTSPQAAVGADGSTWIGVTTPGDSIGLMMGLSACAWPTPLGTGTPGTAGIAPEILPVGGFPFTGNHDFGLVVVRGRGGAATALLLAADASTGVQMFGGTIWVDPAQVLAAVPLLLSGPSGAVGVGAAGLPFAIPANPRLGGLHLVMQAVVLDPAAPQGLAMSSGLDLRVSR